MGYKSLSKKFDVPVSTIQSIIKKYKSYQTVKNLNGQGRKKKNLLEVLGRLYKLLVKIQALQQRKFCKTCAPLVSRYPDKLCKGLCMKMV